MNLSEREKAPFYILATEQEIKEMLSKLNLKSLNDLYSHLQNEIKFDGKLGLSPALKYNELKKHVEGLAKKNIEAISFVGDGLKDFKTSPIVTDICNIRGLTTAYTPYQPERSQGTLQTLWIYQSLLAQLTGFEAINASLYDRSTCLYEAMMCALRLQKDSTTVLVSEGIFPGDMEVIETLATNTSFKIIKIPLNAESGLTDIEHLKKVINTTPNLAGLAFPQVNCLGLVERVDEMTDLCVSSNIKTIAIVDPILLAKDGLKAPISFGSKNQGTDMVVAEGQHLALDPNFGGPGLGIFGIRYNDTDKNSIRSTAGRYIGKTQDLKGRDCKALILSTREQHIRREKATSNICSNQSFVATLAGACLLEKGDSGLTEAIQKARENAQKGANILCSFKGIDIKFKASPFWHEVTFKVESNLAQLILQAAFKHIALGVNVSNRIKNNSESLLMLSFSDKLEEADFKKLEAFLSEHFEREEKPVKMASIHSHYLRSDAPMIPKIKASEIVDYYKKLGEQNLSPDDGIYPLGSCTMKYNPEINDYAASLSGFTKAHPQFHPYLVQGSLEVLYEIQEMFKSITGLCGVTTQPVAGAQGELVGLKMFQAYHNDRGEGEKRNLILIPKSAHGTNPATATMAGYETKVVDGKTYGIKLIDAKINGEFNLEQIKEILSTDGERVAGIMVTNPNTSGIFESQFQTMAQLIHDVGGLVYMDGANMNAIAGIVNLGKLGVDAVHNNLHKTWTIPHGGGGPGDAIVAVSEKLIDFLPGQQVVKTSNGFELSTPNKSIGSFHRHFGNFAHKVRAYTYIKALGDEGVIKMSQVAVLSARYLYERLSKLFPTLPVGAENNPRMHEFILTLNADSFKRIESAKIAKTAVIPRVGKLFLDFGFHAPTVAFPEVYGLMIEPTESYSKKELDQFAEIVETIYSLVHENPEVLETVPHFTPIDRVDELAANKNPLMRELITEKLAPILADRLSVKALRATKPSDIRQLIITAHKENT